MSLSRRRFLQSSTTATTLLAMPASSAFTSDFSPIDEQGISSGFEHLSKRSQQVLRLARQESAELGYDVIRSEHLLLGLIAEAEYSGADWIDNLGASLEDFRCVTVCVASRAKYDKNASGRLSTNADACLKAGQSAATLMGYNLVEPEHLLMAFADVPDSSASLILQEMWFEATALQQEATASLRTWSLT